MKETKVSKEGFATAFQRFQNLIETKSGHPFQGFDEGLIKVWESYKPRLREHALSLLKPDSWSETEIGSGALLSRTIDAIEIQDSRTNLINNLVFWQNRYGHANRDHRILLEAQADKKLCSEIETLLFELFSGNGAEGEVFDQLSNLSNGKYPLVAYLFFLKDIDRFMPIQPTGFDRAFRALDLEFTTLRQCSWDNYSAYNATLDGLRYLLIEAIGVKNVSLVDAHSFCWVLSSLLKQELEGTLERKDGSKDDGRVLGGREKSIIAMRYSVENTVRNANGQIVERKVKDKKLTMSSMELEKLIEPALPR